MKTLVVYDSQFGNTAQIARAIAGRLEAVGPVRVVSADDESGRDLVGVDLLVIGGPTQGHGARHALHDWIDAVAPEALRGVAAATFDTRLPWPELLAGSAAKSIAKDLRSKGARLIAPSESFFVKGGQGPLAEGEYDRALAWAQSLALKIGIERSPISPANLLS